MFQKATKTKAKGRVVLHGPAGSGKTKTALKIAERMIQPGQRIAFVDAEEGSASKYSDNHDFDVIEFTKSFDPPKLVEAVNYAAKNNYGVVIIDSLTPFWKGQGGFLQMVDQEAMRSQKKDTFVAWKAIDAIYIKWLHDLWSADVHIIFTIKAKMTREKTADGKVKTVGYQPEFRDDFIYIPDIEGILDVDHNMVIGKCRCESLDGKVFTKPGADFADPFMAWLNAGVEPTKPGPSIAKASDFPPPDTTTPDVHAAFLIAADLADSHEAVEQLKKDYYATKPSLSAEMLGKYNTAVKAAIARLKQSA